MTGIGRPITGDDYDPSDYSRDKFYCAESGNETIRARVSPSLMRHVNEIVRDPLFTHYVTYSDFVRDALMHLVQYRMEQLSDPGFKLELEQWMETERGHLAIIEIDEKAKAEEKEATIIANRYWKSTGRAAKLQMYEQAIVLRSSGILDDHLKDELRRVISDWLVREAERENVEMHGETLRDLI